MKDVKDMTLEEILAEIDEIDERRTRLMVGVVNVEGSNASKEEKQIEINRINQTIKEMDARIKELEEARQRLNLTQPKKESVSNEEPDFKFISDGDSKILWADLDDDSGVKTTKKSTKRTKKKAARVNIGKLVGCAVVAVSHIVLLLMLLEAFLSDSQVSGGMMIIVLVATVSCYGPVRTVYDKEAAKLKQKINSKSRPSEKH